MARVKGTLQTVLDRHDPYPGVVIDRYWNVVLANLAALALVQDLPDAVVGPPVNIFRASLHPDGLSKRTKNFDEWATYLLGQLHRATVLTGDCGLESLIEEVSAYPDVAAMGDWRANLALDEPKILVPVRMDLGGAELSMFTTLTVFGTPLDVTLAELAVELFYPADDGSESLLRSYGSRGSRPEAE
jgi:hypothetical protein